MKQKIDIILSTCNRKHFTKRVIEELYNRLENSEFMRLIVIDDNSTDGTLEYLEELKGQDLIDKLVSKKFKYLCEMYNEGFKYVKSEYFIVMQDDIIIPKLKPDVIEQLIDLMEKNKDHGGISCRIQRIPNMKWLEEDLTPARKTLSATFRIQRKIDIGNAGGFGDRYRDEYAFKGQMDKISKKCSWASNLWCNHIGYCENRGYNIVPKNWGKGIHSRTDGQALERKPYPRINPLTNIPLKGERIYR